MRGKKDSYGAFEIYTYYICTHTHHTHTHTCNINKDEGGEGTGGKERAYSILLQALVSVQVILQTPAGQYIYA
jgi:hypothetical protein